MVLDHSLCATIVTGYPSFGILKFGRHRLGFNNGSQLQKLPFHVNNASAANRTLVGGFHMLLVTSTMNTMTTSHEDNGLW